MQVVDRRLFATPADLAALLPPALDEPFTTVELAGAIGQPRWLAQKMAYCVRSVGAIAEAGRQGKATRYVRT